MIAQNRQKFRVKRVKEFSDWLDTLDPVKLAVVLEREKNMEKGTFGDWKSVGEGVCEARIHVGAGVRIYYVKVSNMLVLLLHGGDKGSQDRDIRDAKNVLSRLKKRGEVMKKRAREKNHE
jgi:putative addiction module killer protein